MLDVTTKPPVNGLDVQALEETIEAIGQDPNLAKVAFRVKTEWKGQCRSESTIEGYRLGGEDIARTFKVEADEPFELLGTNQAPNPQELLMSAVNACMMVGYVAQAAVRGINLDECVIETDGELDLRGFLGLDESVPPGYRRINYTVSLKGDGTREQYEEIHRSVMATSPNYFNLSRPIRVNGTLSVG